VMICAACGHENPAMNKFCGECAAPLVARVAGQREERKVVTVLFCDVTGSTELGERLDPEALRILLARYFERMKSIVERHGGSVEKFIGDAVMAVFGVPVLHEDDALRAVRAAVDMRDALPDLGLQGRIGLMTGEVVSGTQERLATGDAVNVAARLEQAAQPGDVLVGAATLALVHDVTDVEEVEPLELKGKAEPVPAYRLLRVGDAPERRHEGRFVGREREIALLWEAWERVRIEHHCELMTVVGDAGVGKSRLVAEVLARVEGTVVHGRCLPYGEGITYWPVVEVLKQLDVLPPEEAAAAAIRSLLGETGAPTSVDEIAWAFRRTLERAAAHRPLVVVFDDIQWGEEAFLDLIEHVALLSSGASILLCCISRPEFTERRAAWPVTLRLEPLGQAEVNELIAGRIPVDMRDKIARAAGGNPLFVEEMLAMAGEAKGEVVVPPTLQALLAARLDQLESAERSVLERGAIEGEVFHRGAVQALAPDETQVTPRLSALVRNQLIRPDRPLVAGEDGFRFRHLLIRDAAYDAMPKARRAELHELLAAWLEGRGAELVELDELIGYHLEQACRCRAELGMPHDERLSTQAQQKLIAAGRKAHLRADYGAAVRLLQRAAALVPEAELDLALETDLIDALYWAGNGHDAVRRARSMAERASAAGDQVGELCASLQVGIIQISIEPEGAAERLAALVERAEPIFRAADDDVALYTLHHGRAQVAFERGQMDAALEAYERAAAHARRAGLLQEFLEWRAMCRLYGSTPVPELLAWLDQHAPEAGRDHWIRVSRALALAMLGGFDEAREILAETRAELAERGGGIRLAVTTAIESVNFERLAGDPAAAAELGAEGCRLLEELGDKSFLSTAAGYLAQALYALDRLDEADAWAGRASEIGASEDVATQLLWRQVRAKVLARRGEYVEAERLARDALAIGEPSDDLNGKADATADLAEVLELASRHEEAVAEMVLARELYRRKGNVVSAERALPDHARGA
jgi:class 3 adenylate cyclase/tetratricopeptide (TPR) repeat protein